MLALFSSSSFIIFIFGFFVLKCINVIPLLFYSSTGDLGALQQLLVDQPNIPKEEGMEAI